MTTAPDALGNVIVVESVPANVSVLLAVSVLRLAMVRVALVAGSVIVTLLTSSAVPPALTFTVLPPLPVSAHSLSKPSSMFAKSVRIGEDDSDPLDAGLPSS